MIKGKIGRDPQFAITCASHRYDNMVEFEKNNGLICRHKSNFIKHKTRKDKLMTLITCKKSRGGGW